MDVKIKYKVLWNSQHSICKGKSCLIMQHVFFEGVCDHVDKDNPFIHSTEFLFGTSKLISQKKKAVRQRGKIFAQIQY